MHDINFRRAKYHLEHYWRQLFGGDQSRKCRRLILPSNAVAQARSPRENANTSTSDINSVMVVLSIEKLEPGPNMDDCTEKDIEAIVDEKLGVKLDCASLTVLKSMDCDQEKETRAADDL
ncbi:unnamed protein product [Peronospora destructor]|uniref:Uncharacterized protein n=1 Tax=Peronospora destructor TaxID=86335 RepID=A0AAV0VDX5_9STRA|nr:unnamed protein product [Peronospora destructor]